MSKSARKEPHFVHGTAVLYRGKGILLTGKSQMGKSDLALRLMDKGARLIADDIVTLSVRDGKLYASAPDSLKNKLEIRGLGIRTFESVPEAKLDVCIDLRKKYDRIPGKSSVFRYKDISFPLYALCAFEESILLKIRLILDILVE